MKNFKILRPWKDTTRNQVRRLTSNHDRTVRQLVTTNRIIRPWEPRILPELIPGNGSSNFHRPWENIDQSQSQTGNSIISVNNRLTGRCKKFNCEQHSFEIKINSVSKTFGEVTNEITTMFTELHSQILDLMSTHDCVRLTFFHESFDRPVGYPFMKKTNFETTNLQDSFENVIQSYREIPMNRNNAFKAVVIIAHLPSGRGGTHLINATYSNQQEFFNSNNSIINVINDDNLCGVRAVIIAIAQESGDKKLLKTLLTRNSTLLHYKTQKTAKKCKIADNACGIPEFKKMEIYFKDYQITIIDGNGKFSQPIFVGNKNNKFIYISYTGSHYNVIKSISRFYRSSYYCHHCKKPYNTIQDHHCKYLCKACNRQRCAKDIYTKENFINLKCKFCSLVCNNTLCRRYHEEKSCLKIMICNICQRLKIRNHVCVNQKYCKNCKDVVELDHKCYILNSN